MTNAFIAYGKRTAAAFIPALKLDTLYLWTENLRDDCAGEMALDESLFHFTAETGRPVIRFYSWNRPALTFGYSEPYPGKTDSPAIRRFTGGGKVEHGEDLTFLLTLPAGSSAAQSPAAERYRWIHEAIRDTLTPFGLFLILEKDAAQLPVGPCFATPVSSDLLSPEDGRKVGGGAQRRSRGSVIHQGSLRLPLPLIENHDLWTRSFRDRLAARTSPFPKEMVPTIRAKALLLAASRYRSPDWNHRR